MELDDDFDEDDDFGDVDEHGDQDRGQYEYTKPIQHQQSIGNFHQIDNNFGHLQHRNNNNLQSNHTASNKENAPSSQFQSKIPSYRKSASGLPSSTRQGNDDFLEKQRKLIEANARKYSIGAPGIPLAKSSKDLAKIPSEKRWIKTNIPQYDHVQDDMVQGEQDQSPLEEEYDDEYGHEQEENHIKNDEIEGTKDFN